MLTSLSNGQRRRQYHLPSINVLLDDNSREAFEVELNRKQDIYSYLLRWQENPTAPNIDPIKPPELRTPEGAERWIGNMLNDNVMHQKDEDDMTEMDDPRHLKPGDYEGTPFLQPGDLVMLKS